MPIISFEAAVHAGMLPGHAEDIADWHDQHADQEHGSARKQRHESLAFRFRQLAHQLRSRRRIHRKVA